MYPLDDPPNPSTPPLPEEFFPPATPGSDHGGIGRELLKQRYLHPRITSEADYQQAYARGFVFARDFLFLLPADTVKLTAQQVRFVHWVLYREIYRDCGLWAETPASFDGRIGADPGEIVPELNDLEKQLAELIKKWNEPAQSEDGIIERLALVAFCHARLVLVHPFRDGNGRVSRLIAQWQEWRALAPAPRRLIPRAIYMSALEKLPRNFGPLLNFFCLRNPEPIRPIEARKPPFPLHVTHRVE